VPNTGTVALSQAEVDEFILLRKEVPPSRRARWTKRSEHVRTARLPVAFRGVQRGELLLVVHVDHGRHWTFKLLRLGSEVLRWDAQPPPHSHSNPAVRPADWPRKFRDRDHEHVWHPQVEMKLARPSAELEGAPDHRAAFMAFCERANIDPSNSYEPPPSGEQMRLPTP
jgi:hypothetical protein